MGKGADQAKSTSKLQMVLVLCIKHYTHYTHMLFVCGPAF